MSSNSNTNIQWHWQPNNDTVAPIAVVAWHEVIGHLITHLLTNQNSYDLSQYQLVKGNDFIVIIGQSSLLPWVDGVQYAMFDKQEPGLWLPCHAKPSIATSLLAKAIFHQFKCESALLWDQPKVVIPLNQKWPLTKELLEYEL